MGEKKTLFGGSGASDKKTGFAGLGGDKKTVFGGSGGVAGNPFTPSNSKIEKFIKVTTQVNKEQNSKEKKEDKHPSNTNESGLNCPYALPEAKKKIFSYPKMDGVNFSRIIQINK